MMIVCFKPRYMRIIKNRYARSKCYSHNHIIKVNKITNGMILHNVFSEFFK